MSKLFLSLLLISIIIGSPNKKINGNKPADFPKSMPSIEGNKAPDFSLMGCNGKKIKLSAFKGKIVILDFWATWCAPCRAGIPDLIGLQNKFKKDLVVIGISIDTQTKDDVIPFIKNAGINYPVAYGTLEVTQLFGGIDGVPTSFVIDKNGNIVDKHIGLVPISDYTDTINKLLKKS